MALLPIGADDGEFTLETRDPSPVHFLTEIKSFSMLLKHGITKLESMEFEAEDYKWKLIIYFDGDEIGEKDDHISVYLSMVGTACLPANWEVNVIFNLFIYNHISDNYYCFRVKARRFHAINSEYRISKLISKKSFKDECNGILVNDKCVFGAEVFVIENLRVIENVCALPHKDPYKREWEISDFSKVEDVWNSEEFSTGGYKWKMIIYPNGNWRVKGRYLSIFLECVDSKNFGAHKKVRATCIFALKNRIQDHKNHSEKVLSHWYSSSEQDWGFTEFMSIGDVSKGFILEDKLQLDIQLSVEAFKEPLQLK